MEETQQQSSVAPSLIGCGALEQFLLLAKTARGPAVIELVQQALDAPGVYVFGELLASECVKEMACDEEGAKSARLLELFAYGTYTDYKNNAAILPSLTQTQLMKLKHLTIISLASKCPMIPYSTLLQELDITDLRELEDLIIDAIYAGIIQAKLDQKNSQLQVECFIGRDIKVESIASMVDKLESWCSNCGNVLSAMEEQMQRANQLKVEGNKERDRHDQDVKQLRQSLKMSGGGEGDEDMKEFADHVTSGPRKKGLRGSAGNKIGRK
ncbi:COP9 signalosome complex subunit 7b-like [Halichondria panicea]|uniref:COP9 signalosome complex subunit 7b-like n=1 Tax=Halichondria panicea TaxID=6063 RepID=UPI00312BB9EE